MFQTVPDRNGWIEQLQFDVVVVSPALDVGEHSDSCAFNHINLRQIYNNYPSISLREYGVAQSKHCIAVHDAAFTLNHRYIADDFQMQVEHGGLHSVRQLTSKPLAVAEVLFFVSSVVLRDRPRKDFWAAKGKKFDTANSLKSGRTLPRCRTACASPLDVAAERKHQQDKNDQAQTATRVIPPAAAVGPCGQSANQQQYQNHQ